MTSISQLVEEFVDKFVAPTIPGSLGAIQVEHVRRWLRPALTQLLQSYAGEVEGMKKHGMGCGCYGHDKALDDALTLLQEVMK